MSVAYEDPTAAIINAIIRDYKYNAKKRRLPWSLTHNRCVVLFTSRCFYCGTGSSNTKKKSGGGRHRTERPVAYNGIDRLNNALGYTEENTVTSCRVCNAAKSKMNVVTFRAWIRCVYKYFVSLETG